MILIGRAFMSIAQVLDMAIGIYKLLILAAVIMTWVRPDPFHPLVKFVNQVTEPVFSAIRKRLPESFLSTGLDFTPIIAFFILVFIESFVVGTLSDMGHRMVYESRISSTNVISQEPSTVNSEVFQYK